MMKVVNIALCQFLGTSYILAAVEATHRYGLAWGSILYSTMLMIFGVVMLIGSMFAAF